ncbi:MAG: hypothetical protein MSS69_01050 [Spirochaetales bacterium]|nr:hypothetical protein [Spirochaetales bacterium]
MKKDGMLFLVVERGSAEKAMDILRLNGALGGTVLNARGTASSSLLSILGFGDSKREVILSMMKDDVWDASKDEVKRLKTKGKAAFLGGEKMEKEWTMIQVICEMGYADDIMAEARKAGAGGGTIIKGHGTAKEDDVKFFGYPITSEKEVLVIVETNEKAEEIVKAIESLPLLSKKGKAVMFTLPVTSFVPLS